MKRNVANVALIQLGPDVHSSLNELARRNGKTKSEIVRQALRGFASAQEGFGEEVLIEVNILLAEMTEAAVDSGIMNPEHARRLVNLLDEVRQPLYGRLDAINGLPSIHWKPKEGDDVNAYEDVQRHRAQRSAMIEPELEGVRNLAARFEHACWLAVVRDRGKPKPKTARRPKENSINDLPVAGKNREM